MTGDLSYGLEEEGAIISGLVGAWHHFGYENPPTPESKSIPPIGERSAEAIKAGHAAIETIDKLRSQLDQLRAQLVSELRQNEDAQREAAHTETPDTP